MVNKALVDKVLRSLPPEETRPASELTESQLKQCIDDALTVVMYWLKCIDNPDLDTEGLLRAYRRSDEDGRTRDDLRDLCLDHLGYDILERLMLWIRARGFAEQESCHSYGGIIADSTQGHNLQDLTNFIGGKIYSNPIVIGNEQTKEFFRTLSYVPDGIYPLAELEMVIACVSDKDILLLIRTMSPQSLGRYLGWNNATLSPDDIKILTRIIDKISERSGHSRLEIINCWVDRTDGFYDLVKMQFDLIRQNVDRAHFPNLSAQLDALNVVLEDAQRCWFDLDSDSDIRLYIPSLSKCVCDLNRLLLSAPGSDNRTYLLWECQNNANLMQGHANPTMQKLGLILAAIGAAVMGIGLSPLLTTGAALTIGAGVAGLITGLGLFVHNRQKGPAAFMQKIHDEIARSPQLVIGSTY